MSDKVLKEKTYCQISITLKLKERINKLRHKGQSYNGYLEEVLDEIKK